MVKSPCLSCEIKGDKNGPECQACQKRIDYVTGLGGFPDVKEITVPAPLKEVEKQESAEPESPAKPEKPPHRSSYKKCKIAGCNNRHLARGYCMQHYAKYIKKPKKQAAKYAAVPNETKKDEAIPMKEIKIENLPKGSIEFIKNRLVLDMTDIPGAADLLDSIKAIGAENFRPMVYQAAKMLADGLLEYDELIRRRPEEREAVNG